MSSYVLNEILINAHISACVVAILMQQMICRFLQMPVENSGTLVTQVTICG